MSNVNIKRAVENIRSNTTVYTPVVEIIVNAVQAIDQVGRNDGKVAIRAIRGTEAQLDGGLSDIVGFEVEDNGIGFTKAHRDSFDTLYTALKLTDGGKGFGRFTCLKYFNDLHVRSNYRDNGGLKTRCFSMGKDNDIIVDEVVSPSEAQDTGTIVTLSYLKDGPGLDKTLKTIARNLVEKLLPYFITKGYKCPAITLSEQDGGTPIRLNSFVSPSSEIREITVTRKTFTLPVRDSEEEFLVRVFKLYAPRQLKSRISLVAHKREVSGSTIHKYVPEFEDEFYDSNGDAGAGAGVNYIVKAYVFGPYLDRYVSLERGTFEFQMDADLILGIAQVQIEREAALIAKETMGQEVSSRQDKKRERVQAYVDEEAPWHKEILGRLDLSDMPYKPSHEDIEIRLQREKFSDERQIKKEVAKVLAEGNLETVQQSVQKIVNTIAGTSKNDLVHYIALRRNILDIFRKSLERDADGKYKSEGIVHDIIFPRKGDTESTSFDQHNLWLIDERLNFTKYVSSDKPLAGKRTERPDLIAYDKRVLFRGDNEASNPITIFEFKKPLRDDFVNLSSKEDPVRQIVRYVNDICDGKYETPQGRPILVAKNTPFYGFVVCELTDKVQNWLYREKDFKPMPDGLGWFQWMENNNLYVEVISWEKVLKDAKMRNQIFFHKLGI